MTAIFLALTISTILIIPTIHARKHVRDCGEPYVKPSLHPIIGHIEDVHPKTWPWLVNICILEEPDKPDCHSYTGLIVGNASRFITNWVLTAFPPGAYQPFMVLVIVGAYTSADLINPKKVQMFTVERIVSITNEEVGVPVITLLKLYDFINLSDAFSIAPVCLPTHHYHDEHLYNNTPGWAVGCSMDGAHRHTCPLAYRQYYANTYYFPYKEKHRYFFATPTPGNREEFLVGTTMMRNNGTNWFAFGLQYDWYYDTEPEMYFERPNLFCNWIDRVTDHEIGCIPFH